MITCTTILDYEINSISIYLPGWLFIALATNVAMILVGRSICGFCVGVASLSLPVYLGESIQPEVRGSLGLLPTVFGNSGKFVELCFISIIIYVKQNLISFLFFLFFGLFRDLNVLHSRNVSSLAKSCISRCLCTDNIFDSDVPNSWNAKMVHFERKNKRGTKIVTMVAGQECRY